MISEELSAPRPRVAVTISASVSKLNEWGAKNSHSAWLSGFPKDK